jgi:hypothetical protein
MALLKTKYLPGYFLERGRAAEGGRGSLTRHLEWLTNALECTECLLEIGDQVFDVFDSYGETHKPVRNT